MSKELLIQSSQEGADIALLQDRRLIELHHDSAKEEFLVGDVYLGRVRKVLPNLNAAFIDIGHEKDAFLHYHDLGPDVRSLNRYVELIKKNKLRDTRLSNFRFEPEIVKTGKMEDVLIPNQHVMVQIVKEPISTKGPRLSSQLSLSGRFLVLMPFSNTISISKKVRARAERDRLRKVIAGLKPKNFGVIIRTNAEGASVADLEQDLKKLLDDWQNSVESLKAGSGKLYSELDRTSSLLRDMVNESFTRIITDDPKMYNQARNFLQNVAPDQIDIVKLHKNDKPIFQVYDVEKQIRSLFNKIVNIGGGAYIVIEHTEAMHVIDVNSGSKRAKDEDQEETALRTNLEAAGEIARQLRLRDMGGIVVVDFIDMRKASNRKQVYERMKDVMKDDRAKHSILPLTKFGLMQVTRQRVRQELQKDSMEPCPVCGGTGEVSRGYLVTEDIDRKIITALEDKTKKSITIRVHPFVASHFTKGVVSMRFKWFMKYKKWVNIESNEHFLINQYDIE